MKRRILSLLLILAICLGLTIAVSAASPLIYDDADLLSDRQESGLNAKLQEVSDTHKAQIIVASIRTTNGMDVDSYVEFFYDSNDLGYGSSRSGVLLLVCMDIREYRILSNGAANDAISYRQIDAISDAIVSNLADGNYAAAFHEFADRCDYYLSGYRNGFPFDWGRNLLIALAVGLVIGLIVALVLKSQLKSVHRQNQANVYIKDGSLRITTHHDIFLYRNVTRRKWESSSSGSRSSGGSRSIGGGKF